MRARNTHTHTQGEGEYTLELFGDGGGGLYESVKPQGEVVRYVDLRLRHLPEDIIHDHLHPGCHYLTGRKPGGKKGWYVKKRP